MKRSTNNGAELAEGYWDQYWKYSETLRNWLVVYGIAGAVPLMLGSKEIVTTQLPFEVRKIAAWLFFIGVMMQVLLALLNKVINWYMSRGNDTQDPADAERFRSTLRFRFSKNVLNLFEIDIAVDAGTIALYLIAMYHIISNLTP
ncbi:MAG: hypothetical protein HY966_08305 [Ignavibacteriales bacterium]|nr:hypothetical protein [Ignavibacteriales bacterium]